jgi:hypothetical protein
MHAGPNRIVITEKICLDVVLLLYGQQSTMTLTLDLDDSPGAQPKTSTTTVTHSLPPSEVIRSLLARYSLADVDSAIRWLELGAYVDYAGYGAMAPRRLMNLTARGVTLAETRHLEEEELRLVYQENPYAAFVAYQFRDADKPLFDHLRDSILAPIGLTALDGRVEGIEAFRGDIIKTIRAARYFICLLTHREQLRDGTFASSVWLYQETGAAVALGKKPLILVERGLHDHYAGELQKNYEYDLFDRANYQAAFKRVGARLLADLSANAIPVRVLA